MQAWRNAMQKELRQHTSTMGVTLARFVVALPFSIIYLGILYCIFDAKLPQFEWLFAVYVIIAAIAQIIATALMVMLFKKRNYAIGVGLAKSEAVIAATLGALFFAAPLNPLAWSGVMVGAIAVWLLSKIKGEKISLSVFAIGLGSGLGFALCTLYIREASLMLKMDYLISAAWVLVAIIFCQTLMLISYITIFEPNTIKQLFTHKKLTTSVSMFSFLGSVGWFSAMSLQTVAMVKTLGQIEVIFTLMISVWFFKEKLQNTDYLGLFLISLGAVLVIIA